jgi:hypothetical protein
VEAGSNPFPDVSIHNGEKRNRKYVYWGRRKCVTEKKR